MPNFDNLKGTTEESFRIGKGGVIIYRDQSSNPSVPTPVDGSLYYNTAIDHWMQYDATRAKWLSVDSAIFQVGKAGILAAGSYLRGPGDLTHSATRGWHAFYNGTVVAFGYTRDDSDLVRFQVVAGGVSLVNVDSSATSGRDSSLNANFSQGAILAVKSYSNPSPPPPPTYNDASNVTVWVEVRWRT